MTLFDNYKNAKAVIYMSVNLASLLACQLGVKIFTRERIYRYYCKLKVLYC